MVNPEHLAKLNEGVEAWNKWRKKNPGIRPDLSDAELRGEQLEGADLRGASLYRADLREWYYYNRSPFVVSVLRKANLEEADLRRADLCNVDFQGANLQGATLRKVDLSDADLSEANLHIADIRRADLQGVCLRGADLRGANLRGADLRGATLEEARLRIADIRGAILSKTNLRGAKLAGAIFGATHIGDVDLSTTIGLKDALHSHPSYLGIETIIKSKGEIPKTFLRGCGVPESLIKSIPSFTKEQSQLPTCFISYSHKDEKFAKRLHADLQDRGVWCWFAPEDMKTGDEFREIIEKEIHKSDKLILILSKNSINSKWVKSEVESVFEKEGKRKKQKILFPIRIDEAIMRTRMPWASEIRRTRQIADFREWRKRKKYDEAFDRLLRDLKTEE